jgi:ribosomal protein S18 acetylase RimI-like enzyme
MTTSLQQETIAPLVTAFAGDPVIRWVYPEPDRYLECFPRLVEVLGAASFERSTADLHPEGAAAAIWIEPEAEPDEEAVVGLLSDTVAAARLSDVLGLLERMGHHHPQTPTWYLPFIGVDPGRQGEGLGGELLARGAAQADSDRLPAYLEASSPRNRALYERHGFEVTGEIRVTDSPPLWPMLRHPR